MIRHLQNKPIARLLLAGTAAGTFACAPVLGKDSPNAPGQEDPAMEAYEPDGLPFGGFRAFPSITFGAYHDDNVFNTNEDEESDWLFTVEPELRIASDWNRHELKLTAGAEIQTYSDFSSEDRTDWRVRADSRLDVTRPLRLFLNAGYEVRHEERGTPDAVGSAAEPTEYALIPLGFKIDYLANRFGIRGEVTYVDFDWSATDLVGGGVITNRDRDRVEWSGTLKLRYEFSPGYRAFISGTYLDRNYDLALDRNGQDRDTTGYYIDAGVAFELTRLITGEVFAGYSSFDVSDPDFEDASGFDYGAALVWYPTELTTVRLEGRRTFEASTLANVGGVYTSVVAISVEHELLRNLVLNGRFQLADEDFEGTTRSDTTYQFTGGAEYLMNRYVMLGLRYDWHKRDSDIETDSFSSNRVSVYLTLRV